MASVRQLRPGAYEARSYLGRDPLTGKEQTKSHTLKAANKREAQRLANEWEAGLQPLATTDCDTFGELLDLYVATNKRRWSPGNRKETTSIRRRYLGQLEPLRLDKITTPGLDVFYAALEERGGDCAHRPCPRQPCAAHGKAWCNRVRCEPLPCPHDGACRDWHPCAESPCRHGRPLSPGTVKRAHNVVSAAFEQAVAWEMIRRNPAEHCKLTEVDDAEVAPPSVEEVIRLLAAAELDDGALAVFLLVAAVTGARRGAVCALRWCDLDLAAGAIAFPRVVVDGDEGIEVIAPTKKKRSGGGSIDPYTVAALTGLGLRMRARALACGVALADDALVFSDDAACRVPWRPDAVTKRVARVRAKAGLPGLKLKALRDFMATTLINAGINPKTVAERGGWAVVETMYRRYTQSLARSDQAAAATIGQLLAPG